MPAIENATVKITSLLGGAGVLIGAIWWAATISADLRFLVSTNVQIAADQKEVGAEVKAHEQQIVILRYKVEDLERQLTIVRTKLPP